MKSTFRLLVAAAVQARNGNHQRAAVLLQEASKSNDIRKCIAAVGAMPAQLKSANASARRAVKASAWPFKVNAALSELDEEEDWNSDLKFDAKDNGKLRDSQVGGFDDDLDLMGLDGDLGDDELVMSAFGEDEGEEEEDAAAEDDEDEETEEEDAADEDDEEKPKDKAEARRIHAALANLSVLAAKAKKKKAKKK